MRVSIGLLGAVVAVVAVDFAWMRQTLRDHRSLIGLRGPALDAGALPMASLVLVGVAYDLTARRRAPRSLRVFVIVGAASVSSYVLFYGWIHPHLRHETVHATMAPIYWAREYWRWLDFPNYLYWGDAVYYTPILMAPALLGGWLGRSRPRKGAEAAGADLAE